MCDDVPNVQSIVFELYERHQPQVITADVNDPPTVSVLEVVQRWEHLTQRFWVLERAVLQYPIAVFDGDTGIRVSLGRLKKRLARNHVHGNSYRLTICQL